MFRAIGYVFGIIGVSVILLGVSIWKKQLIQFVGSHSNVRKKDVKAFTEAIGICTVGFGSSLLLLGISWIMNAIPTGYLLFSLCFILSIVFYFRVQKRYNR